MISKRRPKETEKTWTNIAGHLTVKVSKTASKTKMRHFHCVAKRLFAKHLNSAKTPVKDFVRGEILRKYPFKTLTSSLSGCSPYYYKKQKGYLSRVYRLKVSVQKFFERDV